MKKVTLKNQNSEEIKQVKVGYSWTVFFWGCIPSLIRKDWMGALVILVLNLFCIISIASAEGWVSEIFPK